ncbi:MAG TPA: response regulator transcription factor [Streptosporangiaceae bacterium]|nr:response regulator transcription factor [Streptosporangiaceae bacterium]
MIRVAMVEDHPIVQAGLARIVADLPDVELVATVERIENLDGLAKPDVLLLDLHLPGGLQGLPGVRYLVDLGFRVLVVTGDDTGIDEVGDAVAAGALGYLTKHATAVEYAAAIRAVAAGRGYIGARLAAAARRDSRNLAEGSPGRLTPREAEVAGLVVDGYTNSEIADLLGVGERTIDGHLENIKQKICETRRVRVAMRLKELGYQAPQTGA